MGVVEAERITRYKEELKKNLEKNDDFKAILTHCVMK
jgi:hypothetical protein